MEHCNTNKKESGLLRGIFYGTIPHGLCIGFIVFSILGATSLSAIVKNILIIPYSFQILIALSFIMATISAAIYLRKYECLNKNGIRKKWKYLTILYGTTIFINIFMFSHVFPVMANMNSVKIDPSQNLSEISFKVDIPCTGHAPLIIDELKKDDGVKKVVFKSPNIFEINYDSEKTSSEKIITMEIFKIYKVEN